VVLTVVMTFQDGKRWGVIALRLKVSSNLQWQLRTPMTEQHLELKREHILICHSTSWSAERDTLKPKEMPLQVEEEPGQIPLNKVQLSVLAISRGSDVKSCFQVEKAFGGAPQDVEGVYQDGKITVVQARPQVL